MGGWVGGWVGGDDWMMKRRLPHDGSVAPGWQTHRRDGTRLFPFSLRLACLYVGVWVGAGVEMDGHAWWWGGVDASQMFFQRWVGRSAKEKAPPISTQKHTIRTTAWLSLHMKRGCSQCQVIVSLSCVLSGKKGCCICAHHSSKAARTLQSLPSKTRPPHTGKDGKARSQTHLHNV